MPVTKFTLTAPEIGYEKTITLNVENPPQYIVHFRRPDNYEGEFGFDWMRKEYLPISEGGQGVCVEGLEELKKIYTPFKIDLKHKQTQQPYGDYYVPWLTMFPNHKDKIGKDVELLVTIPQEYNSDEFYTNTEEEFFYFEPNNPVLRIEPSKISVDEAVNGTKITIYCDAPLQEDSFIEVRSSKKALVGKLNVMRNVGSEKNILSIKIVYLNQKNIEGDIQNIKNRIETMGGFKSLEYYLNKNVFCQSLIQCKIYEKNSTYGELSLSFDEQELRIMKILDENGTINAKGLYFFEKELDKKYKSVNEKGIIIFLTDFNNGNIKGESPVYPILAKSLIMYAGGLSDKETYAHEIGHILGLLHSFLEKDKNCILITIGKEIENTENEIIQNKNTLTKSKNDKLIAEKTLNDYEEYRKKHGETSELKINEKKTLGFLVNTKKNIEYSSYNIEKLEDKLKILKETKIYYNQAQTDNFMDYVQDWDCNIPKKYIDNPNKRIAFSKPQWELLLKDIKNYL